MDKKHSVFKELFGEYPEEVLEKEVVKPIKRPKKKSFSKEKILLCFLGFLVFALLFSVSRFTLNKEKKEVLGEALHNTDIVVGNFVVENKLDSFISKFISADYRVNDSGAFGYLYTDFEEGKEIKKQGMISLDKGIGSTYFTKGKIVLLDYDENIQILWDKYDRKCILLLGKMEYFFVRSTSDLYYKNYLGQHILYDFVQDYKKNKDFIMPLGDNRWLWEWKFYTPIDQLTEHKMNVEIFVNPETEYVDTMRVFDGEREIGVFKFEFEEIVGFDFKKALEGYVLINEDPAVTFE
jgi:hypothetical protein